jgi:hypothetical protein
MLAVYVRVRVSSTRARTVAVMHAVATTPVGLPGLRRSCSPVRGGLPRYPVGSAPTLYVSRPAQRSLTLQPACVLSRLRDPLTSQCFSAIRYLLPPPRLLPAGATTCRVGLSPTGDRRLCTAHRVVRITHQVEVTETYQTFDPAPLRTIRYPCGRVPRRTCNSADRADHQQDQRRDCEDYATGADADSRCRMWSRPN